MHAKNQVAMFNIAKVMMKVKVLVKVLGHTHTHTWTHTMTDRPKTIYPRSFDPGA